MTSQWCLQETTSALSSPLETVSIGKETDDFVENLSDKRIDTSLAKAIFQQLQRVRSSQLKKPPRVGNEESK